MGSNFFDIPFRSRSALSDFSCHDGEVAQTDNSGTPPAPDVEFGITRTILKGWHIHPDVYPSQIVTASTPEMEYWNKVGRQLLAQFQNDATAQDLFTAPFYVMAAWRTYGGAYLSPTTPILLIPNSEIPAVTTDGDTNQEEMVMKIAGAIGSLHFKMNAPEILRDFIGKISHLEILVSEPLFDFNRLNSFIPMRGVTSDNYCEYLDETTWTVARKRVCDEVLTLTWRGTVAKDDSNIKMRPFAEVALADVDIADTWTSIVSSRIVKRISGKGISYSDIVSQSLGSQKSSEIIIEGNDRELMVVTRPLKLTGAGDLKMMRKVYLRGNYTPGNLMMEVYGSRDMMKWWKIAGRKGGSVVLLPRSRFRFLRVEISGMLHKGETLEGIVITP